MDNSELTKEQSINDFKKLRHRVKQYEINEDRYRQTLTNHKTVLFSQDIDLRYTKLFNPHSGFENQTVLGKKDYDLLPEKDAIHLSKIKQQAIEQDTMVREIVKTTIDGDAFYYDMVVEPDRDKNGKVIGIFCSSSDITERKRIEFELKKYRETLESKNEQLQTVVDLAIGREVRMAELKKSITKLTRQLKKADMTPIAYDPLLGPDEEW